MTRSASPMEEDGRFVVSGRVAVRSAAAAGNAAPARRPLRVARTLAVAHEIARLIRDGSFVDQADAARVLGFTRARITQLIDLTMLAPDIQDEILVGVPAARDPLTEHRLREVVRHADWGEQRAAWRMLLRGASL